MVETRKHAIEIIEDYMPSKGMRELNVLIREAIKSKCPELEMEEEIIWRDLLDKVIFELAYLCLKEENQYRRTFNGAFYCP